MLRVGYARVSSEEQARGLSVSNQVDRLIAAGVDPLLVITETGSATKRRTSKLHQLFQRVRAGEIGVLVAVRQDRLQRNRQTAATLWELIDQHGLKVELLDETDIDRSNPASCLQAQIVGSFAQYETEMLKMKTKSGIAKSRALKRHHGPAPFGYSSTKGRLTPHPEHWRVAREAVDIYLRTGSSTEARDHRFQATGHTWSPSSFAKWINSVAIRGAVIYDVGQPDELIHWGCHEQLITEVEYDNVKTLRRHNSARTSGFKKRGKPTIGSGLFQCACCGKVLIRKSGTRSIPRYFCSRTKSECEQNRDNRINQADVAAVLRRCVALAAAQIASREVPLKLPEPDDLLAKRRELESLLQVKSDRLQSVIEELQREIAEADSQLYLNADQRQAEIEAEFVRMAGDVAIPKATDEQLRSVCTRYGLVVAVDNAKPTSFRFERLGVEGSLG